MKALKASHRENKRYLLLEGKNIGRKEVEEAILKFIGILGYANACPNFIKNDKNKVILAINREQLDTVRASFFASGKDIQVKKVSGMINKLL